MSLRKLIKYSCFTLAAYLAIVTNAFACTTVVVGKSATTDGSTIIARNEDAKTAWTKRFVVHPKKTTHKVETYRSKGNGFTYKLPKTSYKYTATPEWTKKDGEFEEAGINEHGVAMSATESANANDKALKADPLVKNGIGEDSMVTVVLPYIKNARDGVERLGKIVEKKGSAEVNGVIFSDKNEVWYMEIGSGHHWVATRVPDSKYAVIPNKLCIDKVDLKDTKNYMGSKDLVKFAKEKDLYNPKKDKYFSFKKAFGTENEEDAKYNNPRMWDGQRILTPSLKQNITSKNFKMFLKPDKKISVSDVSTVLKSHFNGTPYDPYGNYKGKYRPINVAFTMESHILQCRPNLPSDIGCIHWLSLGVPETSVFVPFYSGINQTPKQYREGTDTPDTNSAYWTYRTTGALTTPYYNDYMKKYTKPQLDAIQEKLNNSLKASDKEALKLYKRSHKKAENYMTEHCKDISNYSLKQVRKLNGDLLKATTSQTPVHHDSNL